MELPELEPPRCPPLLLGTEQPWLHWADTELLSPLGQTSPVWWLKASPPPSPLLFTVFVKWRAQLFAVQCYTCPSLHQEVILSFWDLRDTQRAANPSVLHWSAHFCSQVHKGPWFPPLFCSEMDHEANTCELKQSFTTTSCPGSDITHPTKIQLWFWGVTPGFTGVNETRLFGFFPIHSFRSPHWTRICICPHLQILLNWSSSRAAFTPTCEAQILAQLWISPSWESSYMFVLPGSS